ncbi:hypothetical protein CYMTET_44216, partial [Cymbomonas tetramitiformis]
MDLVTKECERVCKKQRTCAAKTDESVNRLMQECLKTRERLASEAGLEPSVAMQELYECFGEDFQNSITAQQKELQGALSKFGKAVEKHFIPDISKAMRDKELDREVLDQVVAQHIYREGNFELGDTFVREANFHIPGHEKEPYTMMHSILEQIAKRNLGPATEWVHAQRALQPGDQSLDELEFKLHRLRFIQLVEEKDSGRKSALKYAREHFGSFSGTQMAEIKRLMGCLLYSHKLESSPYT